MSIVIIGAGGHAKVVADALLSAGETVAGFVDANPALHGTTVLGLPVLGSDHTVRKGQRLANGIGSIGDPGLRAKVEAEYRRRGFEFVIVRHPSAVVGRDVVLGDGCQIMASAVVQPGTVIGQGAIVNTRAAVDHDCRLGDFVHVAPGAVLSGAVTVGEGSHVGTGAAVIQGIRIGAGCMIGAGAVVVCDVADGQTVTGVPARRRNP